MEDLTFKTYEDITPAEKLDTEGSLHCKACDIRFNAVWREEHQAFEEMCDHCLRQTSGI